MITKNDTLLLLGELQDAGIDTTNMVRICSSYSGVSPIVIKFINSHRPFNANRFYERLRKSYNEKRSTLYINIMREDLPPEEVMTTLCSYLLQSMLYCNRNIEPEEAQTFLKQVRFDDVSNVIYQYSNTYDPLPCVKMLQLIKADIKAFQYYTSL